MIKIRKMQEFLMNTFRTSKVVLARAETGKYQSVYNFVVNDKYNVEIIVKRPEITITLYRILNGRLVYVFAVTDSNITRAKVRFLNKLERMRDRIGALYES